MWFEPHTTLFFLFSDLFSLTHSFFLNCLKNEILFFIHSLFFRTLNITNKTETKRNETKTKNSYCIVQYISPYQHFKIYTYKKFKINSIKYPFSLYFSRFLLILIVIIVIIESNLYTIFIIKNKSINKKLTRFFSRLT